MHYITFFTTPGVPSDYFNNIIPLYNLQYVYHGFNIRKPLCQTNIFANDFLTVAPLLGTVCLVLSLIKNLLVAAFKRALVTIKSFVY